MLGCLLFRGAAVAPVVGSLPVQVVGTKLNYHDNLICAQTWTVDSAAMLPKCYSAIGRRARFVIGYHGARLFTCLSNFVEKQINIAEYCRLILFKLPLSSGEYYP